VYGEPGFSDRLGHRQPLVPEADESDNRPMFASRGHDENSFLER
jgi:hypothetical protein